MGAKRSAEVKRAHKAWLRGNSVPDAARVGGVSKVALYKYLRKLGINDFKQYLRQVRRK